MPVLAVAGDFGLDLAGLHVTIGGRALSHSPLGGRGIKGHLGEGAMYGASPATSRCPFVTGPKLCGCPTTLLAKGA